MAIETYELGPGTLTLGAGPLDVAAQILSGSLEANESVTRKEGKTVLSGLELPASEKATYGYTLKIKLLQDISTGGVIEWSWTNRGTEQPFEYVPSTAVGTEISGTLRPFLITIGGDVGDTSPESDFTWAVIGDPDIDFS